MVSRADEAMRVSCTAAIISPTHVLTAGHCVDLDILQYKLRLGQETKSKTFNVRSPPVELNRELDFAIFEVEGNPGQDFGTVTLLVRDPVKSEKVAVMHFGEKRPLQVVTDCEVLDPVVSGGERLPHSCITENGSSGALVIAVKDGAVLGMNQVFAEAPFLHEEARSLRDIAGASPIVGALAWIKTTTAAPPGPGGKRFSVSVSTDIPEEFKSNTRLKLNGKEHALVNVDREKRLLTFLGDDDALLQGLNLLEGSARQFKFWNEEKVLSAFEDPYKKSYAVIVAIDDYERASDVRKRGKTGFSSLTGMVDRAKELVSALREVGFSESNIFKLYDEEATATTISETLAEFWKGGKYVDADRVLFYFGGHGDGEPGSGYLVTYDIDPVRPDVVWPLDVGFRWAAIPKHPG